MLLEVEIRSLRRKSSASGFSLLELLASVAIITLLMGALFGFMFQAQKRLQGGTVISESNQTARAAMELMSQEIGQAGFNPQFTSTKKVTQAVAAAPGANCYSVDNATGIHPGDWVAADTGDNYEVVKVVATSSGALSSSTKCGTASQIRAVFLMNHSANFPIASYKFAYPTGILQNQTVSYGGSTITVSNDHVLAFYGDIDNNGTISYVVYTLYNPTSGSPTQVSVNGTNYYLYNLYRSITPVTFDGTAVNTNAHASPLVENVIYKDITSGGNQGPTGQAIFGYAPIQVAITPAVVSVVGTVVINLCVAVNPKALETGTQLEWYTMATQIRPLNLWSAVTVNVTGGSRLLAPLPPDLPAAFPSSLSNYYF
jgi:prepilin-type N-terminal cleavage/methylation domain-containing protein